MKSISIVNKRDINKLFELDDIFIGIHTKFGPPPNWKREQGFISLVKTILEQQVSLSSAAAHFKKLESSLPALTPTNILNLSDDEMRTAQVSRQKAMYLKALATIMIKNKNFLNQLANDKPEVAKEKLMSVKGIGHWTAEVYLMFCLQAKDYFPIGDIAAVNALKSISALDTREQIIERTETWRPLRTLGTFYLWHYYLCSKNRIASI